MAKELTFEESMEKLEEIANELEKNDLSLDESIKKFEEDTGIATLLFPMKVFEI